MDFADHESYPPCVNVFKKNLSNKFLQHFLSFELLDIKEGDVYMDVASSGSVVNDILRKRFSDITCYRQDLSYPKGVKGDTIGSNANEIPLKDETITKMGLHCSYEHFEGDADSGFVEEAFRLLKPGGRVCIIPLYVAENYHILTNAEMWLSYYMPKFEKGTPLYFSPKKVNVHGRFYDPEAFRSRVARFCPGFTVKVYHFSNCSEMRGCPRFACMLIK